MGYPDHIPVGAVLRGHVGFAVVFVTRMRHKKTYTCSSCRNEIPSGLEHALIRTLFRDHKGYDHHHMHLLCSERNILKRMTGWDEIPESRMPMVRTDEKIIPNPIHKLNKKQGKAGSRGDRRKGRKRYR